MMSHDHNLRLPAGFPAGFACRKPVVNVTSTNHMSMGGAVTVINAFASLLKCLNHEHISARMLQLLFFSTVVNSNIEQVVCERDLPVFSFTDEKLQYNIISIIKAI